MAKIQYEKLSMRVCEYCKSGYKPTGPAQKVCVSCRKKLLNLDQQLYADIARFKKFGTYDWLGQGYSNIKGKDGPCYKNGIGEFHKQSPKIKEEIRYCEGCGKDLLHANRYQWCIHHIDRDRTNNTRDNYKLLCKRCHQLTHNCEANLPQNLVESAETIPSGSTPK